MTRLLIFGSCLIIVACTPGPKKETESNIVVEPVLKDTTESSSLRRKGEQEFYKGNFSKSLSFFESAIRMDTNNGKTFYYYGRALGELNRIEESNINLFSSIRKNYGNGANAYFYMGLNHFNSRDYLKAQFLFTEVIQIDSTNAKAYRNRGMCYYYLKENAKACIDFTKAFSLGDEEVKGIISKYCEPNGPNL